MISGKTHIHRTAPDFSLIDAGQALYHPNYLIVADQARAAALEMAGYPFHELWKDGYSLAVRENTSEYFKPVWMGQKLAILTSLVEATGSTLRVRQRFVAAELVGERTGFVAAFEPSAVETIHSVTLLLVSIRLTPIKAARLPEKLRAVLEL